MFSIFRKRLIDSRRYGLALGGVLTESNNDPFDRIEMSYGEKSCVVCLADWWGVKNKEELNEKLVWLFEEGHRTQLQNTLTEVEQEISEYEDGDEIELSDYQEFLVNNMHMMKRLGFYSWDLSRLVNVARWGYGAKYLSEDVAWAWIHKAAVEIQKKYSCWKDTGDDFILGYRLWSMQFSPLPNMVDAYERLLTSKSSPWASISWETKLNEA
ncbi:MAG: DUF1266 domain-containing protein [Cyanobacteria bacterium P01_F01_bin.3]